MTQAYSPGVIRAKTGTDLKGRVLSNFLERDGTLLVVGSEWNGGPSWRNGVELPDGALEKMAEHCDVVLTGNATPDGELGIEKRARMGVSEVAHLLCQDDSLGGEYDQVVFLGVQYNIATGMLSKLKHYSDVTTISADRRFQPDADMSFPNLSREDWKEEIREGVEGL